MRVRSWQVGIGLASMLLGMLLVFQLRAETNIRLNLPYRNINQLASYIHRLETDKKRLEEEIRSFRRQLREYDYDQELQDLRMASGIYPLRGPGLEIVLTDSAKQGRTFMDPNLLLVHYDHLELLVNELWVAGAEAVSVNGERVVTGAGFTCAGSIILVGNKKVAPPYVVRAIGDAKTLKAALTMPGGFVERQIYPFELEITITEKDNLYIVPYRGSVVFEYAKVVEEEEEEEPAPEGEGEDW